MSREGRSYLNPVLVPWFITVVMRDCACSISQLGRLQMQLTYLSFLLHKCIGGAVRKIWQGLPKNAHTDFITSLVSFSQQTNKQTRPFSACGINSKKKSTTCQPKIRLDCVLNFDKSVTWTSLQGNKYSNYWCFFYL